MSEESLLPSNRCGVSGIGHFLWDVCTVSTGSFFIGLLGFVSFVSEGLISHRLRTEPFTVLGRYKHDLFGIQICWTRFLLYWV